MARTKYAKVRKLVPIRKSDAGKEAGGPAERHHGVVYKKVLHPERGGGQSTRTRYR